MGAFIDQVQQNNALQREQLTYKKQKEAERKAKQEEKELIKIDNKIVREMLTAEMDSHFLKTGSAENSKAYFNIIKNRNATINKLFTRTVDKEEAQKIYYDTLNKLYKQHKNDEEARAHFEELEENEWTPEDVAWLKSIEEARQKKIEEQHKAIEEENKRFVEGLKKWAEKEDKKEKQQKFFNTLYVLNWIVNILLIIFCLPLGLLFCFLTAVSKSSKK